MEPWIITNSGIKFNLLEPTTDMINIQDIAHALSNICRFGGHSNHHYSVAQHSVLASHIVPDQFALTALMHDATEAYIGDMVSPLKHAIPQFKQIEQNLWEVIAQKYNLPQFIPEEVKYADLQMLKLEKLRVMPVTEPWDFLSDIKLPHPSVFPNQDMYIYEWSIPLAKHRFIKQFNHLTK